MFHPFTIRFHLALTMNADTDAGWFELRPAGDV